MMLETKENISGLVSYFGELIVELKQLNPKSLSLRHCLPLVQNTISDWYSRAYLENEILSDEDEEIIKDKILDYCNDVKAAINFYKRQ